MAANYVYRTFHDESLSLDGKALLVTGATGSFGRAFIDSVLKCFKPRRLIVFSRDEFKQSEMAERYQSGKHPSLRFFIGDVRDQSRLEMAMRDIDIVIHAAALKQVPAAEYNPFECINTNVIGAENVVQACMRAKVRNVISLSTDKAANPINLYGASKLASDKIFVSANNISGEDGPKFSVVRYGNVLNSRGSVIPLFRKLVRENAESIPITDPEMTRFWITLDQGISFVLSSLAMMQGGEIFVPKIPSMRATEMADAIAPGMKQHCIGIRPGEKLNELMITSDDARNTLEMDDRYIITPAFDFSGKSFRIPEGAKPVDPRFSYASDANKEWLDKESLLRLIEQQEDQPSLYGK